MTVMERETTLKMELARTFSYIYDSTYPLYIQLIYRQQSNEKTKVAIPTCPLKLL